MIIILKDFETTKEFINRLLLPQEYKQELINDITFVVIKDYTIDKPWYYLDLECWLCDKKFQSFIPGCYDISSGIECPECKMFTAYLIKEEEDEETNKS